MARSSQTVSSMRIKAIAGMILVLCGAAGNLPAADDPAGKGQQLATDLWRASGGENWEKVKELHFTFIVEENGKELARVKHHWNVAEQTDHVIWKDKDVTVNLVAVGESEEAKAAYARWVNDSYWLLAPLKVRDPGVKLEYMGQKEAGGAQCETVQLSFEQTGLTPTDRYLLYLHPETKLLQAWDYMPSADKTMHGSWDKYEEHGGLKLSTEHQFGGKVIRFTDIQVVTK